MNGQFHTKFRVNLKFAAIWFCSLFIAWGLRAQTAALPAGTKFVMSHFAANGGGGDERLYISTSPDGLTWTALNNGNPVWQPANWATFNNVVRDPAIIYNNGFWWVAYTSGNYGHHASFGLVKSPDLLNWTFVGEIDATVPGAAAQYGANYDPLTWNPVFYRDSDGTPHVFVNVTPINGSQYNPTPTMHPYELHPTSADWSQWSAPALISLPSTDTNEFYVWKVGQVYYAIYVDFNFGGQQTYATSNSLLTGWTLVKRLGYNSQEGGMVIVKPDGGYRLYLEPGDGGQPPGYRWADSSDSFTTISAQQTVAATVTMRNGKMAFISTAPAITTTLGTQTVDSGQPVAFSISGSGSGPLAYQWAYNGTPIVSATNASYVIPAATIGYAGSYTITVSDQYGASASSNTYTLTINPSAIETWRQTYYGVATNSGNATDLASPYNTGIQNLTAFAFGLIPSNANPGQLPQQQMSGGNLFYDFTQPAGVGGITYGAAWSTTLQPNDWTPVVDTGSGGRHIFNVSTAGKSKVFLKLIVTEP